MLINFALFLAQIVHSISPFSLSWSVTRKKTAVHKEESSQDCRPPSRSLLASNQLIFLPGNLGQKRSLDKMRLKWYQ